MTLETAGFFICLFLAGHQLGLGLGIVIIEEKSYIFIHST